MGTAFKDSREGVARYDHAKHSWMGPVFGGHDPGVCAHCIQAITLCLSGILGQAKTWLEQALSLADTLKQGIYAWHFHWKKERLYSRSRA